MSRLTSSIASVLLLLCSFFSCHQALAAEPDPYTNDPTACEARDATSLLNCVTQLKGYNGTSNVTTQIIINQMIECAGVNACKVLLTGTQAPPKVTIMGYPNPSGAIPGLHRTSNFGYGLIDIEGWSNVTIRDLTIHDDPQATLISVDGSSGAISCASPLSGSTPWNELVSVTTIGPQDTGVSCSVPGYVTTGDSTTGYADSNATCFAVVNHVYNCLSDVTANDITGLTISGMTVENAVGAAVNVSHITDFYFLNNTIANSYDQGLWVSSSTDVSIEGNYFFANRGAGMNVDIASSWGRRPSDVYNNVFNHNQHGDAFSCDNQEGCSGGEIGITGSDFVFYGNTFINGFMDFYDPNVFNETLGYDAFAGCDLSVQCSYASTGAGQLWANGGGVDSGLFDHSPANAQHRVQGAEITANLSGNVVFSNNTFDYGGHAMSFDGDATSGPAWIYNNEMYDNSDGMFFKFVLPIYMDNNCTSGPNCGAASDVTPTIVEEGPTTAARERSDCGDVNCLWTTVTEAWAPGNSLALGGNGTEIKCALKIYGPGGATLLATAQGSDATCTSEEGTFVIPASVAQHYTSVQIAYENLTTGQVSAKQLVPLAGMVPTITAASACANNNCLTLSVTDGTSSCAVGLYNPSTNALLATVTGSSVTCAGSSVTATIPTSLRGVYASFNVNYQNLTQGTWSALKSVPLNTGGGGGGGGGGCGTTCQQQ